MNPFTKFLPKKKKESQPRPVEPAEIPEDLKLARLQLDGVECTRKLTRENVFFSLANIFFDLEPSRLDTLSLMIVERSYGAGMIIMFDDGGYIVFNSNRWPDINCNLNEEFIRAKMGKMSGVAVIKYDQYCKDGPSYYIAWEQAGTFFIRFWFDLEKHAGQTIVEHKKEADKRAADKGSSNS